MTAKNKPFFLNAVNSAVIAGALTFVVIGMFLIKSQYSFCGSTKSKNVFVYLASSFLRGRLDLNSQCPSHDLSVFHGKLYAMWPPLAGFLLMPFVHLYGTSFGDKWLSVFLVAVSAAGGWLMIDFIGRRSAWDISLSYKILLTIFLSCGTSFLILSLVGTHYGMAQVVAAAMMFLALYFLFSAGQERQYLTAGIFWSLALLSRMHLILAAPVFLYVTFFGTGPRTTINSSGINWQKKTKNIICLMSPIFLTILFLAWYNWARFGSIWDCGIQYHQMDSRFKSDYSHYGYIHPHYFWRNVYYTLIRIPFFPHLPGSSQHQVPVCWTEGYSIFFQSPVLLYALNSLKTVNKDALVRALWLSIIPVSAIILMLMGTGWVQFGARYLFDLLPLLFPLTVIGSRGKVTPLLIAAVFASVIINVCGLFLLGIIKLS